MGRNCFRSHFEFGGFDHEKMHIHVLGGREGGEISGELIMDNWVRQPRHEIQLTRIRQGFPTATPQLPRGHT